LGDGVAGSLERKLERLEGDLGGLRRVKAGGARLGRDAWFAVLKSGAGRGPIAGRAEAGEFFKKRVGGGSEDAGEQASLVTGVEG
jgi:hypothetical protein